jgi:Kef-type K+ transport system membrane component KefB
LSPKVVVPAVSLTSLAVVLGVAFFSRLLLGLVPKLRIFFISSGMRFDIKALLNDTSTLLLVPIFLVALLVVRGVPALVYRAELGGARPVVAAGLLQATSLPFIVTASMIGVDLGALTPAVASAFVAAGLVSALVFPVLSLALLRSPATVSSMPPVEALA